MYFEPQNRLLLSGDALWEGGMGFVWPEEGANPWIESAHAALDTIERLDPVVVIPGHGAPFGDARAAIGTVRARLDAFARDPAKNARHVVKVMFVFALLERGSMAVGEVAGYLGRVGCYRDMTERFLGEPPEALAGWLVADLERAGAVRVEAGRVRPTMPA